MIMQKRTNNFYKIRENKFNSNIPKKVFENNAFEQFDKFNKTESKTYAKNIITNIHFYLYKILFY